MDAVTLPRLMISAAQKSSGKTTISLGLLSHLKSRGVAVRSFKKGPDYIDPMWHKLASGSECYNLDPYLMGQEGCLDSFFKNSRNGNSDFCLIEGNHGLHDGLSLDGSDSSAGLASMLKTPVLLVVDSRKTNRGVAALVMGMQAMQPQADIAGVILNQVQSARQAAKQKLAIEHYCKVPVFGAIPVDEELVIPERHLGLTTVGETADAAKFITGAAERLERYCDMAAIRALFSMASPIGMPPLETRGINPVARARVGVFRDAAFCFYYPDNLAALQEHGAELIFIDSMSESSLPDIDGLYLGGGFPESFFDAISSRRGLLRDVRERVKSGMPLYAECGGLIYLSRSAEYGGKRYDLAGVLPLDIGFQQRPAGHGYLDLRSSAESAWFKTGERIRAHEFHYSRPLLSSGACSYQFEVLRGYGVTGERDGAVDNHVFASFAHVHALSTPGWAPKFVSLASIYKDRCLSGWAVPPQRQD
ncbi:cobyrinate a,c-diamide synthase [Chlorobium phaeobacteroides]|uniref:Cobyrinate a,c-diamide synthase n=1 Tax=Chlorobium phaeobacteroides (strain DSM 266 / SMG 266 / 2430) TaxID=290317 RepID=A1BCR9_CHLPD|nr:cobyrinate a,c-diamide synthase [Chlorobium phaeobacteroides]ABL64196.1 cobyrinate a,c-diamide synthase [Chlorobium phaeobacteroides DSM 266]